MKIKYSPVPPNHIPKGSMCMSCRHAERNCGHLDFSRMPVMSQGSGWVVVRCTEFKKRMP